MVSLGTCGWSTDTYTIFWIVVWMWACCSSHTLLQLVVVIEVVSALRLLAALISITSKPFLTLYLQVWLTYTILTTVAERATGTLDADTTFDLVVVLSTLHTDKNPGHTT
jgi:hypothetical protein